MAVTSTVQVKKLHNCASPAHGHPNPRRSNCPVAQRLTFRSVIQCRCSLPAPANTVQKACARGRFTRKHTQVKASAGFSASSARYTGPGPYGTTQLGPIPLIVPIGQSSGGMTNIELEMYRPVGNVSNCPIAIISAGFLLNGSLYRSYALELASWGYVSVLYDLNEVYDDTTTVNHLRSIMDICQTTQSIAKLVNTNCVYLIGHSRGAKLSTLAAARDARVKGLCLLDPVDNTPMTPQGPGYPSAIPSLRSITTRRPPMPVAVVGAALNADVVPAESNYRKFVASALGPCWDVELKGAGHLQFIDRPVPLLAAFSAAGPTPDDVVRKISRAVIIAWGERLVRPLAEGRALPPREQLLDAFSADSAELRRLAQLESHLKGLEQLPSSSQQAASTQSQQGRGAESSRQQQSTGSSRYAPITNTYEQLLQRRAKELKEMLTQRGIDCSDCFEKEDLARRLVERCAAQ